MVPMFSISMIQLMTQTAQTATQRVACIGTVPTVYQLLFSSNSVLTLLSPHVCLLIISLIIFCFFLFSPV